MNKRIVISVNTTWNVYNFRLGLIRSFIERGYEVIALAPSDEYAKRLEAHGCKCMDLPIEKNGSNPFKDMLLLFRYYRKLRSLRPTVFLSYTIKPNVYGSIAAHLLGIPVVNNIAGLGSAFIRENFLTKIVRLLYRVALGRSHRVFFQNQDDLILFSNIGLVDKDTAGLVPGSGLNLSHYNPEPLPEDTAEPFKFLMVARVLKDKGVEEFAEAARLLKAANLRFECQLLGTIDNSNPNAIAAEQVEAWERDGLLKYLGNTDDVRPYLRNADCVVLPSYREGVPRSLLEAAAMARPTVATDVVGCRDAVDDGVTGLLCEVKNASSLADKMEEMMSLHLERRREMGYAGREKMEAEFDERLVIHKYHNAVESIVFNAPTLTDLGELGLSDKLNS